MCYYHELVRLARANHANWSYQLGQVPLWPGLLCSRRKRMRLTPDFCGSNYGFEPIDNLPGPSIVQQSSTIPLGATARVQQLPLRDLAEHGFRHEVS